MRGHPPAVVGQVSGLRGKAAHLELHAMPIVVDRLSHDRAVATFPNTPPFVTDFVHIELTRTASLRQLARKQGPIVMMHILTPFRLSILLERRPVNDA
jgi:hypothetical protein